MLTDRDDLDAQIYKTFTGDGVVNHDRGLCRAASGVHLGHLLGEHKPHVFALLQKFNQKADPNQPYSRRDDVIAISNDAHHTQYSTRP